MKMNRVVLQTKRGNTHNIERLKFFFTYHGHIIGCMWTKSCLFAWVCVLYSCMVDTIVVYSWEDVFYDKIIQ